MTFIIADDVYYARVAVEKMILEWDPHSEILANCGSGTQVIEQLERRPPDILVTDIRMPGADGLELAALVQRKWPKVRILLISGYANFSYAQQAISSGVCGYLLKPLKKTEFFEALDDLSGRMRREREQDRQIEAIQRKGESFRLLQYFYRPDAAIQLPPRYGNQCASGYRLAVASVNGNGEALLRQQLEENWPGKWECHEDLFQTGNTIVLLFCPDGKSESDGAALAKQTFEQAGNALSKKCPGSFLGVSLWKRGVHTLPDAFMQAHRALCLRLLESERVIALFEKQPACTSVFSSDERRVLRARAQAQRWDEVRNLGGSRLRRIHSLPQLERWYQELLSICYSLFAERHNEVIESGQPLWAFAQTEQLWQYLFSLAGGCEAATTEAGDDVVEDLKRFLEANYHCELSLNELAATKYYMNPNYLSRLFKNRTGKGFSHYLRDVRMQHARTLLEEGTLSINEVSSLVGYTSPSHFIQSFKKVFGETPGNLKAEHEM